MPLQDFAVTQTRSGAIASRNTSSRLMSTCAVKLRVGQWAPRASGESNFEAMITRTNAIASNNTELEYIGNSPRAVYWSNVRAEARVQGMTVHVTYPCDRTSHGQMTRYGRRIVWRMRLAHIAVLRCHRRRPRTEQQPAEMRHEYRRHRTMRRERTYVCGHPSGRPAADERVCRHLHCNRRHRICFPRI